MLSRSGEKNPKTDRNQPTCQWSAEVSTHHTTRRVAANEDNEEDRKETNEDNQENRVDANEGSQENQKEETNEDNKENQEEETNIKRRRRRRRTTNRVSGLLSRV